MKTQKNVKMSLSAVLKISSVQLQVNKFNKCEPTESPSVKGVAHEGLSTRRRDTTKQYGAGSLTPRTSIDRNILGKSLTGIGENAYPGSRENPYIESRENPYIESRENTYIGSRELDSTNTREHDYAGNLENVFLGNQENAYIGNQDNSYLEDQEHVYIGSRDNTYLENQEYVYIGSRDNTYLENQEHVFIGSRDNTYLEDQEHVFIGSRDNSCRESWDNAYIRNRENDYIGNKKNNYIGRRENYYTRDLENTHAGNTGNAYIESRKNTYHGSGENGQTGRLGNSYPESRQNMYAKSPGNSYTRSDQITCRESHTICPTGSLENPTNRGNPESIYAGTVHYFENTRNPGDSYTRTHGNTKCPGGAHTMNHENSTHIIKCSGNTRNHGCPMHNESNGNFIQARNNRNPTYTGSHDSTYPVNHTNLSHLRNHENPAHVENLGNPEQSVNPESISSGNKVNPTPTGNATQTGSPDSTYIRSAWLLRRYIPSKGRRMIFHSSDLLFSQKSVILSSARTVGTVQEKTIPLKASDTRTEPKCRDTTMSKMSRSSQEHSATCHNSNFKSQSKHQEKFPGRLTAEPGSTVAKQSERCCFSSLKLAHTRQEASTTVKHVRNASPSKVEAINPRNALHELAREKYLSKTANRHEGKSAKHQRPDLVRAEKARELTFSAESLRRPLTQSPPVGSRRLQATLTNSSNADIVDNNSSTSRRVSRIEQRLKSFFRAEQEDSIEPLDNNDVNRIATNLQDHVVANQLHKLRDAITLLPFSHRSQIVNHLLNGQSLFLKACIRGHTDMVKFLLDECGAHMELKGLYAFRLEATSKQITPLWGAVVSEQQDVLEELIRRRADVNSRTDSGLTPVNYACVLTNIEMVQALTRAGADINLPDSCGRLCLANAVVSEPICRYLIGHGTCVNHVDITGCTALHYAIKMHQLQTVRLLLRHGADVRLKNMYQDDALRTAALYGTLEILECIIQVQSPRLVQIIQAYELMGATFVDGAADAAVGVSLWRKAIALRHLDSKSSVHQSAKCERVPAYGCVTEVKTEQELCRIEHDCDALEMQALLVRERILTLKHPDTILRIMHRRNVYQQQSKFQRSAELLKHLYRYCLRQFVDDPLSRHLVYIVKELAMTYTQLHCQYSHEMSVHALRSPDVLEFLEALVSHLDLSIRFLRRKPEATRNLNTFVFSHWASSPVFKSDPCICISACGCGSCVQYTGCTCDESPPREVYLCSLTRSSLHIIQLLTDVVVHDAEKMQMVHQVVYKLLKLRIFSADGETLLHLCLALPEDEFAPFQYFQPAKVIGVLLECGADPNDACIFGSTPLQFVFWKFSGSSEAKGTEQEREKIVRVLLKHGAHADTRNFLSKTVVEELSRLPYFSAAQHFSLKCLAARVIIKKQIPFRGFGDLPLSLVTFVEMH